MNTKHDMKTIAVLAPLISSKKTARNFYIQV